MHETEFATKIISKAEEFAKGQEIESITVEVGDLAHLPAEDLKLALKAMVPWRIDMIEKKALVECKCGYRGAPKIIDKQHSFTLFACPKCKTEPRVIEGKEIFLKEVRTKGK